MNLDQNRVVLGTVPHNMRTLGDSFGAGNGLGSQCLVTQSSTLKALSFFEKQVGPVLMIPMSEIKRLRAREVPTQ